eukprot:gene12689-14999_t
MIRKRKTEIEAFAAMNPFSFYRSEVTERALAIGADDGCIKPTYVSWVQRIRYLLMCTVVVLFVSKCSNMEFFSTKQTTGRITSKEFVTENLRRVTDLPVCERVSCAHSKLAMSMTNSVAEFSKNLFVRHAHSGISCVYKPYNNGLLMITDSNSALYILDPTISPTLGLPLTVAAVVEVVAVVADLAMLGCRVTVLNLVDLAVLGCRVTVLDLVDLAVVDLAMPGCRVTVACLMGVGTTPT